MEQFPKHQNQNYLKKILTVVFLSFGFFFFFQNAKAETGLLGNWKFEEGSGTVATDSSGNGNNGAITGAAFVDGKYGKGLSFDGNDDKVSVPSNESLENIVQFTIEAWIYPEKNTGGSVWDGIVTKGGIYDGESSFQIVYDTSLQKLKYFVRWGTGSGEYKLMEYPLPMEEWSHVAFTLDLSRHMKIYVNGKFAAMGYLPEGKSMKSSNLPVFIGGSSTDSAGRYFHGKIDEARIYSIELSDEEIYLHANGKPKPSKTLKSLLYWNYFYSLQYNYITANFLDKIKDSPFDSFTMPLSQYQDYKIPENYFQTLGEEMNMVKSSPKKIVPLIGLKSIFGFCDSEDKEQYGSNCTVTPSGTLDARQQFFADIPYMDLWNESGALQHMYDLLDFSLRVSKETNAGAIMIDPEPYNNYNSYSVEYIATKKNKTPEEIIARLKQIGGQMADIVQARYPDATIWFAFADLSKKGTTSLIAEGMLERIKEKGYGAKVVDGGESYLRPSVDSWESQTSARTATLSPYLQTYPAYKQGAVACPFKDIALLSGTFANIVQGWKDLKIPITITKSDDFLPIYEYALRNYEYFWVYWGCGYNDYDSATNGPFRSAIKSALCGNGTCEENRAETAASCPADCSGTPTFKNTDLNEDSRVDMSDLNILKSDFLKLSANLFNPKSDIDKDGQCTIKDAGILMGGWR